MTARIIDGRAIAAAVKQEVAAGVRSLTERGVVPALATVLVGEDPVSRVYVNGQDRDCAAVGIHSRRVELSEDISETDLIAEIRALNEDPTVDGILVQLPVPPQIHPLAVQEAIAPEKDVDGLSPVNIGRLARGKPTFPPCTPKAVVEMLIRSDVPIEHSEVVVVGAGALVGMPLSIMLAQDAPHANATVTICHAFTRDLRAHTHRAETLVAAAGKPKLITADMVRPGATVVDVAVNRLPDGTLCGDVDYGPVAEVAGAITPVPGGVGPVTRAMLLVNLLEAAGRRLAAASA